MNQGKIIEYIDQGKITCSVCLQDSGNRLHLLTPYNREVNLPPKRALLVSQGTMNALGPREELLSRLRQTEEARDRLKEEIQVEELWDLIREEEEAFDHKYLAQLCFGEAVTDEHVAAIVRALFDDKIYFKMRDGRFLPNSDARVEEIIRQRDEELRIEEELRMGSAWIMEILQDREVEPPANKGQVVDLLTGLAVHGKEAPDFQFGKEMLLRAGISDITRARMLLVKLGVWEEDEPVDLIRFDIKTTFNEAQIRESDRIAGAETATAADEDLTGLDMITIDGAQTKDFDDALSIAIDGDCLQLGVHIADVARAIPPGCLLDEEASQRGSSLYLPRHEIPMIPPRLSQEALSLLEGHDRPAISLLARFNRAAELLEYRFTLSRVKVQRRLTYDEANERYQQDSALDVMHRLSMQLQRQRMANDALMLSLPDVSVNFESGAPVSLELVPQDTPSRTIVAEFMILYNWLAARFCKENDIPILYRSQEGPKERLKRDDSDYLFFVFQQRRKLNRLVIDTTARPHSGLGLDLYTNVSSPIRRYFDLVNQRQILNFLLGRPPAYSREEMANLGMALEPVLKGLAIVKRNRIRYWTLKYLARFIGNRFSAIVLDTIRNGYRILLTDFLLVDELRREPGQTLSRGDHVKVKVRKSDPWEDVLDLTCSDR